MNRFEDIFRPFLQGNVARELLRAPIQHIDAQRERRQITARAAARELHVSPDTFLRWARGG